MSYGIEGETIYQHPNTVLLVDKLILSSGTLHHSPPQVCISIWLFFRLIKEFGAGILYK